MKNRLKNIILIVFGFSIGATYVSYEWMMETIRPKGHRLDATKSLIVGKKQQAFKELLTAVDKYREAEKLLESGQYYNDPTWPWDNLAVQRIKVTEATIKWLES